MEQWLNVTKQNFIKNSPELDSLQALYDHEFENLTVAMSTTVQDDETVKVSMQVLEITHRSVASNMQKSCSSLSIEYVF